MYVGNIYVPPQNYPLIGVGFTFTILGVVTVCLRVFTRGWLIKHFGTDDALIVFSGVRVSKSHQGSCRAEFES